MNNQQPNTEESTIEKTAELLGVPVDVVESAAKSCARELTKLFGGKEAAIKALQDDLEGDMVMIQAVVSDRKRKHKFMCIDAYKNIEKIEKMVYEMVKNPLTGGQA